MDKVGDLFDKITPMVETMDFNKENAAILLLGADFDHECATYQGSVKSLVALLVSAMENREELSFVVLKAAEIFLAERNQKKEDDKEDGTCDS